MTWRRCTRPHAPIRSDNASSAEVNGGSTVPRNARRSLRRRASVGQAEQRVHRLAHLVADHRLRVVMGALLGEDEALGLACTLEQRAPERWLDHAIVGAMHDQ